MKKFVVCSDFSNNIYPRYLVNMSTFARRVLLISFVLGLWSVIDCSTDFQGALSRAYSNPSLSFHRYLTLFGIYFMPLITPFLLLGWLMLFSERIFSEKYFNMKSKTIKNDVDMPACASVHFRTMYRFCASLNMNGKSMIFEDRIVGLINGDLNFAQVGRRIDSQLVQLTLNLDQITAMWIAKDVIIMRFCWGETYHEVWDVILNRSLFIEGNDRDFIAFVTKEVRGKELTYDVEDLSQFPGDVRLANKSTNLKYPWTQRRVKIYHNFWGPFKKRERKSKEKETEK